MHSQSKETCVFANLYCCRRVTSIRRTLSFQSSLLEVDSVGNVRGWVERTSAKNSRIRTNETVTLSRRKFELTGRGLGVVVLGIGWITEQDSEDARNLPKRE
jgi:hypothetical protein